MEHIRKKWIVLDNYAYKSNSFCFIRVMKEEFDIRIQDYVVSSNFP